MVLVPTQVEINPPDPQLGDTVDFSVFVQNPYLSSQTGQVEIQVNGGTVELVTETFDALETQEVVASHQFNSSGVFDVSVLLDGVVLFNDTYDIGGGEEPTSPTNGGTSGGLVDMIRQNPLGAGALFVGGAIALNSILENN